MSMTKKQEPPKIDAKIDMSAPDPLSTINRSALARELGISVSLASRLMTKKRGLRLDMAYRIAEYLGIDVATLRAQLDNITSRKEKDKNPKEGRKTNEISAEVPVT